MSKKTLAVVWIVAWVHVFFFAPPADSSIKDLITAILQMDNEVSDPFVFMVFNLLGIWPLIMITMLVQDNQGKLKAWPFALSSMVLGNSALYVYLFLRKEQQGFVCSKTPLIQFAESKILALFLFASAVALLVYGFSQGSTSTYVSLAQESFFVDAMTVDSILFPIAFAFILADDMRRRNMAVSGLFWFYALVPVLGATIYLVVRAPLADQSAPSVTTTS